MPPKPQQLPVANIQFINEDGDVVPYASPRNREEVRQWVRLFFGLTLPTESYCPGHVSPLDALCASYFGTAPVVIWKASRGLGGKSTALATLAMLHLLDGAEVVVLGGSSRQSKRVHEVEANAWEYEMDLPEQGKVRSPLVGFLAGEPTTYVTKTKKGNKLTAIAASTKSARGPHPNKLLLDEIDEMNQVVLDAAMGQPMAYGGHRSQTTMSSTHQYPDGTMTNMLKMAAERDWPVMEWCWRETHEYNGGWLTHQDLMDTRSRVTKVMWDTEYDLQEPSHEGRLIDTDAVGRMFMASWWQVKDKIGQQYTIEKPRQGALYATGADWAKDQDYTVIWTLRYDCKPARFVAYERVNKMSWPAMIEKFNDRVRLYPGKAGHDIVGIGSVINDYIEVESEGVAARGALRDDIYTGYVVGIESGRVVAPEIETAAAEHKYVTRDDVYTAAGHVPDTVAAAAIAWYVAFGKHAKPKKQPGRILVPRKI